jgi:hypothetical protein
MVNCGDKGGSGRQLHYFKIQLLPKYNAEMLLQEHGSAPIHYTDMRLLYLSRNCNLKQFLHVAD